MQTVTSLGGILVFLIGGAGLGNYVLYWRGRYDDNGGRDKFLTRHYLVIAAMGATILIFGMIEKYF